MYLQRMHTGLRMAGSSACLVFLFILGAPLQSKGATFLPGGPTVASQENDIFVFEFSGTIASIDQNDNSILGNLKVGDPFTGSFSYALVPDSNPSDYQGVYHQEASLRLMIGNHDINYVNSHVYFSIGDNHYGKDRFSFAVDAGFGDWEMGFFGFSFEDPSQTAFSSDDIPASLDVSKFAVPLFRLDGSHSPSRDHFSLDLTVLEIRSVPEPSASGLLTFASISSILFRRLRNSRFSRQKRAL
jgi:hypothetical protein